MADQIINAASLSTAGKKSRVWFQKGCHEPLVPMGCIGVKGITDNVQTAYSDCYDDMGRVLRSARTQIANPTDITINAKGNGKAQAMLVTLARLARQSCAPYLWGASMACENIGDISKPSAGDVFWKVKLGPGNMSPMNDTFRDMDAGTNSDLVYQGTFAQLAYHHYSKPEVAQFASFAAPAALRSLAILDSGSCENECSPCGTKGCQYIAGSTDTPSWVYNNAGGNAAWTTLADVGHAAVAGISRMTSIDGRLFASGNGLSVGIIDPVTGTPSFTSAVFEGAGGQSISPTLPLSNPVKLGDGNLGVAGGQGTFYVSKDGVTWIRVIAPNALKPNVVHLGVADDGVIYGLGYLGTDVYFLYSTTRGRSWVAMAPAPLVGVVWSAVGSHDLYVAGNEANFVVNGRVYTTACGRSLGQDKSFGERTEAGAPFVTNVGMCEGDCDVMYSVSVVEGYATLRWTVNGFAQKEAVSIVKTLTGGSAVSNPWACCETPSGVKTVFAIGPTLYSVQTYVDVVAEEIAGV